MCSDATKREAVLALHAEELVVAHKTEPGATVRVQRVTNLQQHFVDEEVRREQVEVVRFPIDREITEVPDTVSSGDLTIIPVVEEQVTITRRLILKEEIHLRRIRTTARHQETVMLRVQEAIVTSSDERMTESNSDKGKD